MHDPLNAHDLTGLPAWDDPNDGTLPVPSAADEEEDEANFDDDFDYDFDYTDDGEEDEFDDGDLLTEAPDEDLDIVIDEELAGAELADDDDLPIPDVEPGEAATEEGEEPAGDL